jgi:hypothetical protein
MSADDLDSLNETLHALRTPGIAEELAQADADYAAGKTLSGEEIRNATGCSDWPGCTVVRPAVAIGGPCTRSTAVQSCRSDRRICHRDVAG